MDTAKNLGGFFLRTALSVIRWVVFLFLTLCVLAFMPSLTSLAMGLAALLVCPIKRIKQLPPFEWVRGILPAQLSTPLAANLAACVLFIVGVMASPASEQANTRSASTSSQNQGLLQVTGPIEYTTDAVNIFDYVSCSDEGVKVEALDDVNAREVGTHIVEFKLTRSFFSSSKETVELTVQDTKAPEIQLSTDHIDVAIGDELDATQVVRSVTDPVDGELSIVESEPKAKGSEVGLERFYESGWYVIELPSTDKAGTSTITVIASDQHGNRATETVEVEVADPFKDVTLTPTTSDLEYSNKGVETVKLVNCSDDTIKITAEPNPLDLTTLGDQKVTYTLEKDGSSKEVELTFHIRDTKNPTISINKDEVVIEQGGSFDPYSNVSSVRDEVDGDLTRVTSEQQDNGEGWYTITGSYDVNKASRYFFTVVACDNHGNRTTKEFSLLVNEPVTEASTSAPVHGYILNTNTHKFHYPGCYDVNKMKESNKWYVTKTRDEVIGMGYDPCQHCHP